MLFFL